MAIIKCPECGHQISDKAPVCPSCGVEIAGKITRCPHCGEVYLKNEIVCPHCHQAGGDGAKEPITSASNGAKETRQQSVSNGNNNKDNALAEYKKNGNMPENMPTVKATGIPTNDNDGNNNKKNNKATLLVSIIIALIVVSICFYKYNSAQGNKELEEYEFAMRSDDPMILQTYLNNFKDAPQAHIDSINAHLQRLTQQDQDWNNAIISGSKSALSNFLKMYPESPHKQEAIDKIDSIDWEQCRKSNTVEAYQLYMDEHSDGLHYDEAELALKKLKSNEVSIEEKEAIGNIFHRFFVSINSKDESGLTSTVGEIVNFLGKSGATKADVVSFMHKLYKADVKSMVWSLSKDYNIQKKEIGDGMYEYNVSFMANQNVEKTDQTSNNNTYRINAKVDPDGKIVEFSMTKIIE